MQRTSGLKESFYVLHSTNIIVCILLIYILIRLVVTRVYIMRNTGLEEAQAAIKIAGRNINHLRHADDTTLMAESEEELKSFLMKVKEESEKVGLKLNKKNTNTVY